MGGPYKIPNSQKVKTRRLDFVDIVGNISSCSGQKKRSERSSHTGSHIPCGVLPGLAVDRVSTPEERSRRSKLYKRPLRRPSPLCKRGRSLPWWTSSSRRRWVDVGFWAPKGMASLDLVNLPNCDGMRGEGRIRRGGVKKVAPAPCRCLGSVRSTWSSTTPTSPGWR